MSMTGCSNPRYVIREREKREGDLQSHKRLRGFWGRDLPVKRGFDLFSKKKNINPFLCQLNGSCLCKGIEN